MTTVSDGSTRALENWKALVHLELARLRAELAVPSARPTSDAGSPSFADLLEQHNGAPLALSLPDAPAPRKPSAGWLPVNASNPPGSRPTATGQPPPVGPRIDLSHRWTPSGPVERVPQRAENEYRDIAEARRWGPSACSAATLTALLRSRGTPVRITDVIGVMGNAIDTELGLVSRPGFVRAAESFGLSLTDRALTYDDLTRTARPDRPVALDITNGLFPEGHWLVVTGADPTGVDVVDSSGYALTRLTRGEFLAAWSGRAMVPA